MLINVFFNLHGLSGALNTAGAKIDNGKSILFVSKQKLRILKMLICKKSGTVTEQQFWAMSTTDPPPSPEG